MATTQQRTGFRLPWASEALADEAAPAESSADLEGVEGLEGVDRGSGTTIDGDETAEGGEAQAASAPVESLAWPAADAIDDRVAPEHDAGPNAPVADVEAPAQAPAARPGRRDNPLVAGLVRAMREAATATRLESAARFAEEAKAQIEAIHAHSGDEATRLRKQADSDILEIRDWSKTEMARIREATEVKISDRRRYLESEVEALSARVERRVEEVRGAIDAFEQRMDAFFERLLAEEDPARLAHLAEQLPEPPVLEIDISAEGPAFEVLDPDGAAAAEAEALAEIDTTDDGESDEMVETDVAVVPDVERRLAALSAPATSAPEPVTTRMAVSGLASVAGIAGFKRALATSTGVRTVSVASGPTGDFIFTVAHEPETDLRSVVPLLDGFAALITGDVDEVITVAASDPERAK